MRHIVVILALLMSVPTYAKHHGYHTKLYHKKHGRGLKRDHRRLKEFTNRLPKHHAAAEAIPKAVDLSPLVSLPEDQGSCGSCWDFAVTKALRSALMLEGKDPGRLAFNYLLDNCGHNCPRQSGCGGGDFDAMECMLGGQGPWLESLDPYKGYETRCKAGLAVAGTALKAIQVGNERPSFQLLASALNQSHMMVIDVAVCGGWGSYSDGIFDRDSCGSGSIDHMINLVGYDCETSVDASGNCAFNDNGQPKNGDGYLKVMNNWGNDWGENGYMRTRWGMDAVAYTAMYFEVAEQPTPTPTPTPNPPSPGKLPSEALIIAGAIVAAALLGFFLYRKLHGDAKVA